MLLKSNEMVCYFLVWFLFCNYLGLGAHKFLAPAELVNVEAEEMLLVHSKKQWKEISCSTQV